MIDECLLSMIDSSQINEHHIFTSWSNIEEKPTTKSKLLIEWDVCIEIYWEKNEIKIWQSI